ncbi:MAG TPA: helix-turn-helix transcriptional regulator [Polyangiaceae bacterium]|nr:helix-turn-helix transcriptional regulator [Polyangiaceae bacterium]
MSLGKDVRRRRLALGLTLEQVAEKARLSPNYVGSVEMGRRDPSLSTVLALARALRIPPGDLLGGAQALEGPALEAARLVASLPGEVQEPLLALLRSLARKRR